LESDAAGVAAQVASEPQMGELKALHQELELAAKPEKVDRERFFEVNERFHMKLLEIADNRWRDQMVADLRKVMKLNRHNSLFKSGRVNESLQEHRQLVEALVQRNAPESVKRMRTHFQNGLNAAT
jgi:DNA-binding GntR family transcriptional regulator